jgi:NAD(P)-dependent dehydrogenase (short-subunit alcohol dehydrogenase family)
LARAGAWVAVLDLNLPAAQAMADDITQSGGESVAVQVDVLDRASLERALAQVLEHYGRVDILITGAGGNKRQATTSADLSFFDLPPEALQWVFNLNVLGTVLTCQVFGRQMAAQDSGVILNFASISAFRPLTNIPAYAPAKAAVVNLTQWLAVHMSQNYSKHIRVNALAPGFFQTEQNRFLLTDEKSGELTQRGHTILDHTPLGRFGVPEELIGAALWLVSGAADFVHGSVVTVDGGFSAFAGV